MQATMWYLLGILVGTSLYGLFRYFLLSFDPQEPSPAGLWLLVFLAPYALMQIGLVYFLRAAWVITPQFVRSTRALKLRRRVQQ